jgi:hypothetical protein
MTAAQKNIVVVSEIKTGLGVWDSFHPAGSVGFLVKDTFEKMPGV